MSLPINEKINKEPTLPLRTKLTVKERTLLSKMMDGKINPNSVEAQYLLSRPHVAITFEALLEKYNLSDDRLCGRLAEIVGRKPLVTTNRTTGTESTNAPSVDANAREVIKMIWQAQGKFVDRHELGGPGSFKAVPDDQLDKIIDSGVNFLANKGKNRLDGTSR